MSGSGSGGRGGNGGTPSDDCSSIVVETPLNSPVQSVIKKLKSGDELEVSIETAANMVKTLVAKDKTGQKAGSLTPLSLTSIINCIEKGYNYIAVVLDNPAGGLVRVRIQNKP
jgi:hypothetical protein